MLGKFNLCQFLLVLLFSLIGQTYAAYPKEYLKSLSLQFPNGVIELQPDQFHELFRGLKPYHMIVQFTSLTSAAECVVCRETVNPMFQNVARFFYENYPDSEEVFFISIDFKDNKMHFQEMNMPNVPHIWIYPKSTMIYDYGNIELLDNGEYIMKNPEDVIPLKKSTYKVHVPKEITVVSEHYTYAAPSTPTGGQDLEALEFHFATFVGKITGMTIVINRPLDNLTIAKYAIAVMALFIIVRKRRDHIIHSFTSWRFWALLSILLVIICISGLNFCLQRQVQFLSTDATKKKILYLLPDSRSQNGFEVFVSIGFQIFFCSFLILLISVPNWFQGKKSSDLKSTLMLLFGSIVFLLYIVFGNVYLLKDTGYPFSPIDIPFISQHRHQMIESVIQ